MNGSDLTNGWLERADMKSAHLVCARLRGAILRDATFGSAELTGAVLRNCRAEGGYFADADLRHTSLREAWFDRADLRNARLDGANATKAVFKGADLRRARLRGCVLRRADFAFSDLSDTRFNDSDLREAILEDCWIDRAGFDNAVFSELSEAKPWERERTTRFAGAALRNLDLSEITTLTAGQLNAAFADRSVLLPKCLGDFWPDHWPNAILTDDAFKARWLGWRRSRGRIVPPPVAGMNSLTAIMEDPKEPTPDGEPIRDDEREDWNPDGV